MTSTVTVLIFLSTEFPEEPVDNRSLYDRLEEQRQKAQDEFEEKVAFSK